MSELSAVISELDPAVSGGRVGFFWIVNDRACHDAMFGKAIDLTKGELYGPSVVHPGGHYKFWSRMQQRGPAWLRAQGLSAALLTSEYEDWPRGRVSFSLETKRFVLFIDPRLRTPERIAMIQKTFRLTPTHFEIRSDGHYQPVKVKRLEPW